MCAVHLVVQGQKGDSPRGLPTSLPAGLLTAPCPRLTLQSSPYANVGRTALTVSPRLPVTSLPGSLAPQAEDRTPHRSSGLPRVLSASSPGGPLWPARGSCSLLPASQAGPALPVFSASPRTLRTSAAGPVLRTVPLAWCCNFWGPSRPPKPGTQLLPPASLPRSYPLTPFPAPPSGVAAPPRGHH